MQTYFKHQLVGSTMFCSHLAICFIFLRPFHRKTGELPKLSFIPLKSDGQKRIKSYSHLVFFSTPLSVHDISANVHFRSWDFFISHKGFFFGSSQALLLMVTSSRVFKTITSTLASSRINICVWTVLFSSN